MLAARLDRSNLVAWNTTDCRCPKASSLRSAVQAIADTEHNILLLSVKAGMWVQTDA